MREEAYEKICRIAMADPGHRGLSSHCSGQPPIQELARQLAEGKRAMLISGFPVRTETGPVGETDGPSGIAWLARALDLLGVEVRVYTDDLCRPQLEAALDYAAPGVSLHRIPGEAVPDFARREVEAFAPDRFITLERPGCAADGVCYNMNARSISDLVVDAEPLFTEAATHGVLTVAVGDGGNEMGMGCCRPLVERHVKYGDVICARQEADYTLMGGVSNWWGWGLVAALSLRTGRDLLPTADREEELLCRVVRSGGADGSTARHELTVDGLPLALHLEVLNSLRQVL